MNIQILIDNIVRQTTVLIAQLATSGGVRAPLAQVADQVFLELTRELESQGISRKVSADMFGLALRSYRRRIQRVQASSTDRDRSLWEAILDFLNTKTLVPRTEVLRRFRHDDETSVKGVLHDLCESGMLLKLGSGNDVAYRAATTDELRDLRAGDDRPDELVWLMIYREGPLSVEDLSRLVSLPEPALGKCVSELLARGSIQVLNDGRYISKSIVVPVGASAGWEAALFDQFQALVKTMCARLREGPDPSGALGGSTFSYNVWPGHPFEEEVRGTLRGIRERCSQLRQRVQAYNAEHGLPERYERIVAYAGQCGIEHDRADDVDGENADPSPSASEPNGSDPKGDPDK